jgi:hypothetical protein
MKKFLFVPVLLGVLAGCGSAPRSADDQAQSATSDKTTALGRSMDKGRGIATDSNISQINAALGMLRGQDGQAPANLQDAKHVLKDYPAEMWVDDATGKPLRYDPATGTVSR